MDKRTLPTIALILALGCDNSGSTKNGDAGLRQDAAAGDASCYSTLSGRWTMSYVFCGNTNITPSLREAGGISAMTLDILLDESSCALTATATTTGSTCTKVEGLSISLGTDDTFALVGTGISTCQPAQCVFNPNDAPCVLDDGTGEATITMATLTYKEGTLLIVSQPPTGLCGATGTTMTIRYAR